MEDHLQWIIDRIVPEHLKSINQLDQVVLSLGLESTTDYEAFGFPKEFMQFASSIRAELEVYFLFDPIDESAEGK